jgi:murein tripeptide amidase MpaA
MPLFNPDGYEYTQTNDRNWQKNRGQTSNNFCPGTDLSRNYPNAEWGVGGSANPCSEEYNGVVPGSEIETDAHISLLTDNNIDAYLTITGYGQTVSYPYNTEKESQVSIFKYNPINKIFF